jgi:hypothetical protein
VNTIESTLICPHFPVSTTGISIKAKVFPVLRKPGYLVPPLPPLSPRTTSLISVTLYHIIHSKSYNDLSIDRPCFIHCTIPYSRLFVLYYLCKSRLLYHTTITNNMPIGVPLIICGSIALVGSGYAFKKVSSYL